MTSGVSKYDFEWMIAPTSREMFLSTYWAQRPLKISRQKSGYYNSLLPPGDLEFALTLASRFPGGVEEIGQEEKPRQLRNYAAAIAAYRSGKSLRIDSIQKFARKLAVLSRNLEEWLSCPININMYLTPQGTRALPRHYDTHDVFVLQIDGKKRWRVYDSPVSYPLEYLPPLRCESARKARNYRLEKKRLARTEAPECNIAEEFVLENGDLLYLPRGYWHEAAAEPDSLSCHLTVGAQVFTYLDLLTVALAEVAHHDAGFRKPLPPGFGTNADSCAVVQKWVSELLPGLKERIDVAASLGEIWEAFSHTRMPLNSGLLQPGNVTHNLQVDLSTRVERRDGMLCRVAADENRVTFVFGSQKIVLPAAFEACCRFIAQESSFTVAQIPGDLTEAERISLIELLLKHGLLNVAASTEGPNASIHSFEGWLPVRLIGTNGRWTVNWLYFGQEPFSEPFFAETVARIQAQGARGIRRSTSAGVLLKSVPELKPSGFIFHISRCGSTLLANALKAIPGTIVVSEAQPIGELLSRPEAHLDNVYEAERDDLLRAVIGAFGQRRQGNEAGFVVKFSSWNLLRLDVVRRLWPQVPCVVIVRDPLEVMVSCLHHPPGWMRTKHDLKRASRVLGWAEEEITQITDERFCARVLGAFFASAAKNCNVQCRIVDYENLNLAGIKDIARFFGLDCPGLNDDAIKDSLKIYSKDVNGMRPFRDDRQAKKERVTETLREECDRWARNGYLCLKGLPVST